MVVALAMTAEGSGSLYGAGRGHVGLNQLFGEKRATL